MATSKIPHETFLLETDNEPQLFVQSWVGELAPAAGSAESRELLIIHGMGEHSGRYASVIEALKARFHRIVAFDLRGHGRSKGIRGHVDSFDDFIRDVDRVLNWMRSSGNNSGSASARTKVLLYAHSMGSLIGLRFLQKRVLDFPEVKGAVLSSPFLGIRLAVPRWKTAAAKFLVHTLDRLQLSNEINPSFISHDSRVVAEYVKDRLVHNKCTPKLYFELLRAHREAFTDGPLLVPSLFLVPLADELVDPQKALAFIGQQVAQTNGASDRFVVKEYPGFYHEAHHELKKEQVFSDVRAWIDRKLGAGNESQNKIN